MEALLSIYRVALPFGATFGAVMLCKPPRSYGTFMVNENEPAAFVVTFLRGSNG